MGARGFGFSTLLIDLLAQCGKLPTRASGPAMMMMR
jgi:hypothetical protein